MFYESTLLWILIYLFGPINTYICILEWSNDNKNIGNRTTYVNIIELNLFRGNLSVESPIIRNSKLD